jgi:hypothetical protein
MMIVRREEELVARRTSFGQRLSDAFLPDVLRAPLFRPIVRVGPTDINGWSFVHALSGVALSRLSFWQALAVHTAWEVLQALVGDNKRDWETALDVPLDTLFFMAGWWLGQQQHQQHRRPTSSSNE